MAQKTITYTLSDLSNEDNAVTCTFALDGQAYEIDLTDQEASDLRERLAPYVGVARKVGGRTTQRKNPQTGRIREWAEQQGLKVPARGRIPNEIVQKFQAAESAATEARQATEVAAEASTATVTELLPKKEAKPKSRKSGKNKSK